jgi:ATP/ADP translocase
LADTYFFRDSGLGTNIGEFEDEKKKANGKKRVKADSEKKNSIDFLRILKLFSVYLYILYTKLSRWKTTTYVFSGQVSPKFYFLLLLYWIVFYLSGEAHSFNQRAFHNTIKKTRADQRRAQPSADR